MPHIQDLNSEPYAQHPFMWVWGLGFRVFDVVVLGLRVFDVLVLGLRVV